MRALLVRIVVRVPLSSHSRREPGGELFVRKPGDNNRRQAHREQPLISPRKGDKIVTIPLAPRTAQAVDLAIGERPVGPIFTAAEGRRLDRRGAARIVRRLARRAGIVKRIGPHTLRHAFITAALDAGVPLRDLKEAASHADPGTTMRYDRATVSLDRHASYIVSTYIASTYIVSTYIVSTCIAGAAR